MKRWRLILLSSVALVALFAGGAVALFTNGGFELGNLYGWTVESGTNSTGLTTALENGVLVPVAENITWTRVALDNATYAVTGEDNDFTTHEPRVMVTSGLGNDALATQLPIVKYQNHSVRVNSQDWNYHAHRISQESTLTGADRDTDGKFYVRFAWAAVLQDPGHPASAQPYFHLSLKKVADGSILYSKFFYSNQFGFPWRTDNVASGWKWIDWQEVNLPLDNVAAGDTIRIELSVADCAYGGHGGYAFLDGFRSQASPIELSSGGQGVLGGGCSVVYGAGGKGTAGPGSTAALLAVIGGVILLPLGILRRLHRRRYLRGGTAGPFLILLVVLLAAAAADASAPAVPKGQRFNPTVDGQGAITVDSDETIGRGKMAFGASVNTARQPVNTGDVVNLKIQGDVVKQLWTLDLTGAYGVTPDFEVGFDVKANHVSDGRNITSGREDTNTDWGDIRVAGKLRILSRATYGLAIVPFVNFAAGNRDFLLTEERFGFGGKLVGHLAATDKLSLFASAGAEHVGPIVRRAYTPWIQYGVGGAYALPWRKDKLVLEVNGETIWDKPWAKTIVNPVEALASYRYAANTPGLTFQVGGGGGLNKGIGAPNWRAFVGVAYLR